MNGPAEPNHPPASPPGSYRIFADDGVLIPINKETDHAATIIQRSFRNGRTNPALIAAGLAQFDEAIGDFDEDDVESGRELRQEYISGESANTSFYSEVFTDTSEGNESRTGSDVEKVQLQQLEDDKQQENESKRVWWSLFKGFGALGAVAAIGTVFSFMTSGPPIDEDDVIAAVAIAKGGEAGGAAVTSGAAQGASSAQAAVLQQMAISAANNAASSVASGSQVLAGGNAVGVAGGAGSGGTTSSSGTTTAAATAAAAVTAAAVAAGVVVSRQSGGTPPICPNVSNPHLYQGSATMDFLGIKRYLNVYEARNLSTVFEESYNNRYGCESDFSRITLNCTIPCNDVHSNDSTAIEQRCCSPFQTADFGDVMRCSIECTVHCDGCYESEPFFWVNETITSADNKFRRLIEDALVFDDGSNATIGDDNTTMASADGARGTEQVDIGALVGEWFCKTISPDDPECGILELSAYDVVTGERESRVRYLDPPTPAPSTMPSQSPSASPSFSPTLVPTVSPTLAPTNAPTQAPTPTPPPIAFYLVNAATNTVIRQFANEGMIVLSEDGSSLTFTAEPRDTSNVGSIVFTLDGVVYRPESDPPYALGGNKPRWNYFPVSALAVVGQHELIATTYSGERGEGVAGITEVLLFEVVP